MSGRVLLQPLVAACREMAVSGQHALEVGLGNVGKLLAGHVRFVEGRDHHERDLSGNTKNLKLTNR